MLDPAWATLMDDLKQRGLLDTTLIVWMGEFGRTPKINSSKGRDHWAELLVDGAGRRRHQGRPGRRQDQGRRHGGQGPPGRPCRTCWPPWSKALGIDPMKQNNSNVGRPIRLVEPTAKPIKEVLA